MDPELSPLGLALKLVVYGMSAGVTLYFVVWVLKGAGQFSRISQADKRIY